VVHRVIGTKQAYLFVNDKFNFRGLTNAEITKLEGMGIEEVKVVKHSEGLSYQEVSSDFIPCHHLRLSSPASNGNGGNGSFGYGYGNYGSAAAAILVILLLILLIGGGYYYYKHEHH